MSLCSELTLCVVFRDDMYSSESIDLLHKSGIDFQRHENEGIKPNEFAELLTTSGLVLFDEVKWISFHRSVCFNFDRSPVPFT